MNLKDIDVLNGKMIWICILLSLTCAGIVEKCVNPIKYTNHTQTRIPTMYCPAKYILSRFRVRRTPHVVISFL